MSRYPRQATEIAAKYVREIGLGFHPDTRGRDYINGDGRPTFGAEAARQYDNDMETLFGLCDPYAVSILEMRKAGLLPA